MKDAAPDDYVEINDIVNRFGVLKDSHAAIKAKEERDKAQNRQSEIEAYIRKLISKCLP